jgi:regulator of extracellular matrix RemA (YlzA/DUF370 family)
MKLLSIGFGNYVKPNVVEGIASAGSEQSKALVQESRDRKLLIDCTDDKSARAIIITSGEHAYLSRFSADTLAERLAECESDSADPRNGAE